MFKPQIARAVPLHKLSPVKTPPPVNIPFLRNFHDMYNATLLDAIPRWKKNKNEIRQYFKDNKPSKKGMSVHIQTLFEKTQAHKVETLPSLTAKWRNRDTNKLFSDNKQIRERIIWSLDHPRTPKPRKNALPGYSDSWERPRQLDQSFSWGNWRKHFMFRPDLWTFAEKCPKFF